MKRAQRWIMWGMPVVLLVVMSWPLRAGALAPVVEGDEPPVIFYEALNGDPGRRGEALDALRKRVAAAPDDEEAVFLLGMTHLWCVAENAPAKESRIEHLVLARHYLKRTEKARPEDYRLPSWLLSVEHSLEQLEGRDGDAAESLAMLRKQAERDPCFHSVAYAISVWDGDGQRQEFADAIEMLEKAVTCGAENVSVLNKERWPYNVQGFLVGMADFHMKAGDAVKAEAALVAAEAREGYEKWPHKREVEQRFAELAGRVARFGDNDPGNDPAFIFEKGGPVSCAVCHQRATR